ncbi:hypothetical protein DI270_030750 [Microbispora triticiradicis]|uniref:Uncharacterized protein n=1 Tax=Microbispora triticiradicis TaxID=2200763 RepID=A0ABX9LB80_9ACTN|nr:hypothetical protein DI270_030750 [Microbispora triticiradicis]
MVVILMPVAAADRRSGRRIRAELIRRGALRAVIDDGPLLPDEGRDLPGRRARTDLAHELLGQLRRPGERAR